MTQFKRNTAFYSVGMKILVSYGKPFNDVSFEKAHIYFAFLVPN